MRYTKVLQRLYDWHKFMPDAWIWQIRGPAITENPCRLCSQYKEQGFSDSCSYMTI